MRAISILVLLLLPLMLFAQDEGYGIGEVYFDTPSKMAVYGFSHWQPIKDSTIDWSSYSWLWNQEVLSRHWFQYWFTQKFGLGLELEFWYSYNQAYYHDPDFKPFKLYMTPRLGVHYRFW